MSTGRLRAALTFLALVLAAPPAWAVQAHGGSEGLVSHQIGHLLFTFGMGYQAHGGSEGLVSHQIGHLLFTFGMGYVVLRLRSMRQSNSGWFEFKIFVWLLIVWNVVTFSGHWMNEYVENEKFIKDHANTLSFTIENLSDAIYYLTRLDHLILVPSFAFLLIALRKWRMPQ